MLLQGVQQSPIFAFLARYNVHPCIRQHLKVVPCLYGFTNYRWHTLGFLEDSWSSTLYSFSFMQKWQKSPAGNRASIFRDYLKLHRCKNGTQQKVYDMCRVAFTPFVGNDIKSNGMQEKLNRRRGYHHEERTSPLGCPDCKNFQGIFEGYIKGANSRTKL